MFLLVLASANHIRYITENTGLGSIHPLIILWSEEFSSLNSNYVYNKVTFGGAELEGGVL